MSPLDLTKQLISCPSISPGDAGCWGILEPLLANAGFTVRYETVGELRHMVATTGSGSPHVGLSGHVDVVPVGKETEWLIPPFVPAERGGFLYGRGAADMKGGIACLVTAAIRQAQHHGEGTLTLLLTSDEEGSGEGARILAEKYADQLDYVLVGEPTSINRLGDEYKVGRRGSISFTIRIIGTQGHTAYAHLADNPIHRAAPFLADLVAIQWDAGDGPFPPTSLQIASISAGAGAGNMIPGELELHVNVRNTPATPRGRLQQEIESLLLKHQLNHQVEWAKGADPFLVEAPELAGWMEAAVLSVTGVPAEPSTAGGTSDGRWYAGRGIPTIEFGAINATIHAVNERTPVADLDRLADIYTEFLARAFTPRQGADSVD